MRARTFYVGPWATPGDNWSPWRNVPGDYDDLITGDHKKLTKWMKNNKGHLPSQSDGLMDSADDMRDVKFIRCEASNFGESGVAWFTLDEEAAVIVEFAE